VISVVPGVAPVTIPDDDPIVATEVVPLLHVPPPPSLSVIVAPTQTAPGPVMEPGSGLMVTVAVI